MSISKFSNSEILNAEEMISKINNIFDDLDNGLYAIEGTYSEVGDNFDIRYCGKKVNGRVFKIDVFNKYSVHIYTWPMIHGIIYVKRMYLVFYKNEMYFLNNLNKYLDWEVNHIDKNDYLYNKVYDILYKRNEYDSDSGCLISQYSLDFIDYINRTSISPKCEYIEMKLLEQKENLRDEIELTDYETL